MGTGRAPPSAPGEGAPGGPGLKEARMLNGVQGLIGETAVVTRPIDGTHDPGRIRARGEEWLAVPLDPAQQIPPGVRVVVADVDRGLLVVYPADT